jgi:hypothetical protein
MDKLTTAQQDTLIDIAGMIARRGKPMNGMVLSMYNNNVVGALIRKGALVCVHRLDRGDADTTYSVKTLWTVAK